MKEIDKFVNELKETLNYSKKAKVISEKWVEKLYRVRICNVNLLFRDTIKIIAEWNAQELYKNTDGDYIIIIGF